MSKTNTAAETFSVKQMTLMALMTALICVIAPFSIPLGFSPVPISFTNFAIYIAAYVIGMKRTTISFFIYLLIGIIGVPVFAGFNSGAGVLLGPTGGYLIGFIFLALVSGYFIDKYPSKIVMCIAGMILGLVICYAFGTAWLAIQNKMTFMQAMLIGVVPYLIGDAIKIAVAAVIGPQLRKAARAIMG